MKRAISYILTLALSLPILNVTNTVTTYANGIDYPAEGSEYGYIFTLKEAPDIDISAYDGIIELMADANIYRADTIQAIKAIEAYAEIETIAADCELDMPDDNAIYDSISMYSNETSISLFADELEEIPEETAEEDNFPVNDPLYPYQWSHEATSINGFWENRITGEWVKVGVADTGINREHSAFDGVNIETGVNVCALISNDEEKLYDTVDEDGHGTVVTSIICAAINDGIGCAGITDKVTIVPYRIEDNDFPYATGSALIKSISLAVKDNCDVLNISYGGTETHESVIEITNKAVNYASKCGLIICAAVGNSGNGDNPIEYPAACDNVIGVGGVEPDNCEMVEVLANNNTGDVLGLYEDVIATFTNGYSEEYDLYLSDISGYSQYTIKDVSKLPQNSYKHWGTATANETVFVSAPANYICAAHYKSNDKYKTTSCGTSVATPFVVAAAAGAKQMRPYIDVDMFKEILIKTSVDLDEDGYDINTGYGMVNFKNIYNYVSQMPETAPERTPEVSIDYENEQLVDFPLNREYTINGEAVTVSEDGTLPINEEWLGTTISIVKKASSDAYEDSEPQELEIPARPDIHDTVFGTETGITNNSEYERVFYKLYNAETWWYFDKTDDDNYINLSKGKYLAKINSTSTSFASLTEEIQVGKQTPDITIDYKNDALSNFEDGESYTVNGEDVTVSKDGTFPIDSSWFGTTITITRKASDTYYNDATQELDIPAMPSAPTGLTDGKNSIIGTTALMEYKSTSSDAWKTCSEGKITGLKAGVYNVRYKSTESLFSSEITQIEVKPNEDTPEISIDYENEKLVGFSADKEYMVNSKDITPINGEMNITGDMFNTTITIVCKGNGINTADSEAQELNIPAIPNAPNVELFGDTVTIASSGIVYKEESADTWQATNTDEIITLERGKTYSFMVQYTESSFASEIRQITLQITPEPTTEPTNTPKPTETERPKPDATETPIPTETPKADDTDYELVTSITPKEETNELVCSVENTTNKRIDAVGIIAIYSNNGLLKDITFMHGFDTGETMTLINKPNEPVIVKFFVWDSLQSMKPVNRGKSSEITLLLEEDE